jgi:hypothetical protein
VSNSLGPDSHHLEDKIDEKIAFGNWKNVNMAGWSQAFYHITTIDLPKEVELVFLHPDA